MPNSYQLAVSDGTLAFLDIAIGYLDRSNITVYFNGVITSAWSWVGSDENRILFTVPVPNGVQVRVQRKTPADVLRHTFSEGAAFTASTLDEDLLQALYIGQEAVETNISTDFFTALNMHGNGIKNLAPAVAANDAVTLAQLQVAGIKGTGVLASSTFAEAVTLVSAGLMSGATVIVEADELSNGDTANYQLVGGTLVKRSNFDRLRSDLAASSGASKVGTGLNQNLAGILTKWHFVTEYNGVDAVLDATTGPVNMLLPEGRFAAPTSAKLRDGVCLQGTRCPRATVAGDKLDGGTVLEGTTKFYRLNNIRLDRLGFDHGQVVTDSLYAGVASDGFVATTWDGSSTAAAASMYGWSIGEISAMTPVGAGFHGALIEGLGETCNIGTVYGYGGIASVVIKCVGVAIDHLFGTNGNPYTVVFKSNSYAPCNNVTVERVTSRGTSGGGVDFVADDAAPLGMSISQISVGVIDCRATAWGVRASAASGRTVSDINVKRLIANGVTGFGISLDGVFISRVTFDQHTVFGSGGGVYVNSTTLVDVGDGSCRNCLGHGYWITTNGTRAGTIESSGNGGAGYNTTTNDFICDAYIASGNVGGDYIGTAVPRSVEVSPQQSAASASPVTAARGALLANLDRYVYRFEDGEFTRTGNFTNGSLIVTLPFSMQRPTVSRLTTCTSYTAAGGFVPCPISVETDGTIVYRGTTTTERIYLAGASWSIR